jgi:uncharacterized membrane protein YidH (DUF202 family)
MEDVKLFCIGITCLAIGIYLIRKNRLELKAMQKRDMKWVATNNVLMGAILMFVLGLYISVRIIINLF